MRYRCASGPSLRDCAFLADDGAVTRVVAMRATPPGSPTPLEVAVRLEGDLVDLWRSPGGRLFAVDTDGVLWRSDGAWGTEAGRWAQQGLDLQPAGLVGAGEDLVVVWGARRSDGTALIRGFDGEAVRALPGPAFVPTALDLSAGLVAVGARGQLAAFDGQSWDEREAGRADLLCVDASEGLVVGAADGTVWVSDGDVLAPRFVLPGPVRAVARWRGAVWAGAGEHGLFRDGVQVRADRRCTRLEAHDELLVGCDDVICSSPDGERFPAGGRGAVEALLRARR